MLLSITTDRDPRFTQRTQEKKKGHRDMYPEAEDL
jgi:hypothetical protein